MSNSNQTGEGFDSGRQQLGQVYAKALLGVTEKTGTTAVVLAEFDSFLVDVLGKIPQLAVMLASVRVSFAERETLLNRTLKGRMHQQLLDFLKVVARHGRMDCLHAINSAAHRLNDKLCGRVRVTVTTAVPLSAESMAAVQVKLSQGLNKEVILSPRVNSEVMGGLVIQIGDKVFDSSVKNQLSRLQDEVLTGARERMRQDTGRFVKAV